MGIRVWAIAACCCAGAGCGPSPVPPSDPPVVVPAPTAAPPTPAKTATSDPVPAASSAAPVASPPPATTAALPPAVALPDPVACALGAPQWRGRSVPMRLVASGPPFAHVFMGAATLTVPVGKIDSAVLDFDAGDLSLRGFVRSGAVRVHPAAAFVAGGFVVPTSKKVLELVEGHAGELTVGVELTDDVKLAAGSARARRPCADLTLVPERFDPRTALPLANATATGGPSVLRTGAPAIALSEQPGGKPAAHVTIQPGFDVGVLLLARDKRWVQVAFEQQDAWLFGWIAQTDLRPAPSVTGFGTGSGTVDVGPGVRRTDTLICDVDLPIVAEVGGVRATVGKLKKGQTFKRLKDETPLAPIEAYPRQATLSREAKLYAPADVIATCKPGI